MKQNPHWVFSILLIVVLTCPISLASAANPVASIGEQTYETFSEAVADAVSGDIIVFLSDCALNQSLTLPTGITLDGQQHTLSLGSSASLTASGDLEVRSLTLEINRSARSPSPFVLSGDHAEYRLSRTIIQCPDVARGPNNTDLLTFSASNSTLTLDNCQFFSSLNHTTALLLTGDCSGSTVSLNRFNVFLTPGTGTPRSCFGVKADASGAPALFLDDCTLETPTAAVAIAEDQTDIQATLTDCTITSANPLYISGTSGSYEVSDCTLSDEQTDAEENAGLLVLSLTAEDNSITIADSTLDSASASDSACVFSIQNTQNEISVTEQSAISIRSDALDLVHVRGEISTEGMVSVDDTVDLSAFPIVWSHADGLVCNASTSLTAAASLWRAGDRVTLRGMLAGSIDLQVPVTITGENAALSGSLAIRASGAVLHQLDLSSCAIDCVAGCDLSYNYWGSQTAPSAALTSPYYIDSTLTTLAYAPVPEDQVREELERFVDQIQQVLSQALPGTSLSAFDPLTAGDTLTAYAEQLRASCMRLSQTTTAAQRTAILAQSATLSEQMQCAWRVYWSGVGFQASDSVITLSDQLDPTGSDALRLSLTQNSAARRAVCGISVDGTQIDPEQTIFAHSTLTSWRLDDKQLVQSMTFQTELRTADNVTLEGDGTYRLPVPSQACEAVQAKVNGVSVPVSIEMAADGAMYVTLSRFGTVELTFVTDSPEEPDEPEDPDNPNPPDGNPETTYTVSLRAGSHGSLRLRTESEATPHSVVRITVTPDDGYELDTLDLVATDGTSIDFTYSGSTLRFTMPACDVRVSAQFVRIPEIMPDDGIIDETPALPSDLTPGAWYEDDVRTVLTRGWMSELLVGQFCPDLPASRGDLITALYRMAGQPSATAPAFTDIPSDSAYYAAAIWARASGIALGEPDGRFRPYDTVTREECIALLYRFCGSPSTAQATLPFSDTSSISVWARPAMTWAYQTGILYGNTEGTCTPLAPVTRAETAALLLRLH